MICMYSQDRYQREAQCGWGTIDIIESVGGFPGTVSLEQHDNESNGC